MWQLPKAAAQRALQIEKGLNINPPTRGWTDGVALTKPSTPKLIRTHSGTRTPCLLIPNQSPVYNDIEIVGELDNILKQIGQIQSGRMSSLDSRRIVGRNDNFVLTTLC